VPKLEAGWEVIPIEMLLSNPAKLVSAYRAAKECKCILIDAPFVATVEREGLVVDLAIGVASLVCSRPCGFSPWRLSRPAWGSGVRVAEGRCAYYGDEVGDLVVELGVNGYELSSLDDVFKQAERGVNAIACLADATGLEVEKLPGFCGVIEAVNPLHPLAVIGKPYLAGCIGEYARLVGPRARLASPLLRLAKRPIAWSYEALASALLLGFKPSTASLHLKLAALLGVLYACGAKAD
jgi:hypothetical protein